MMITFASIVLLLGFPIVNAATNAGSRGGTAGLRGLNHDENLSELVHFVTFEPEEDLEGNHNYEDDYEDEEEEESYYDDSMHGGKPSYNDDRMNGNYDDDDNMRDDSMNGNYEPPASNYDDSMHGTTWCWEEYDGRIVTSNSHTGYYADPNDNTVRGHEGSDYQVYMYGQGGSRAMSSSTKPSYSDDYNMDTDEDDDGHMYDTTGAWCRDACSNEDWCMAYEYWYDESGQRCELWTHWTGYTEDYAGYKSYVKMACDPYHKPSYNGGN
jgi:hypothetical protein